jgi:MFS family permease
MLNDPCLGFPFCFGVFQDYYSSHEPFSSEPSGIAIIGTTAMGIMYLGAPVNFAFLQRWPRTRRPTILVGLIIIIAALIASSFANRVWQLIMTQGFMYAVGGSMVYCPTILFLDEWFIQRKGFAFGVMWAGTGAAGAIVPLAMSWGLSRYSFRTMLRTWAICLAVLTTPLLYYLKPRLPISHTSAPRRFDLSFMFSPSFLILQAGNILEGMGFFIPSIYLPTYARSLLGSESNKTAIPLALLNTASVFGQIILGAVTDRWHVTTAVLISAVGATISALVLWGLATSSFPLLCIFGLMYGLFAGGFTSTYTGTIREVRTEKPNAEPGLVFGFLAAGRGIGSVASGPLSEALLKGGQAWRGKAEAAYGTGYGPLIIFTGVTAALSSIGWVGRRVGFI